jgi:hypothetical protein
MQNTLSPVHRYFHRIRFVTLEPNRPIARRTCPSPEEVRLCARYRRLSAAGKKLPVVVAAIAREMAAFLWAIGREVAPS